jgi:DNA-binding NtrC family response regulator
MKGLFRLAAKVARSDTNILIEGEMGTGKASLASAVHALSARHHAPFRAVRCASATTELIERHLADGGTLFFDDVAELSADAQVCPLRVLEGIVMPVDGSAGMGGPPKVDVRVIAATCTPLHREVERGRFRADLMYRLRIVSLHLPPLRARRGDIALLVEKFIGELNAKGGRRIDRVAPAALVSLERHGWPGNVRELRVCVESAFATGEGNVLVTADLPREIAEPFAPHEPANVAVPEPRPSNADEAARLRRTLERASGDRSRAATMLGMSRTTLWRRMRALGLLEVHRRARQ